MRLIRYSHEDDSHVGIDDGGTVRELDVGTASDGPPIVDAALAEDPTETSVEHDLNEVEILAPIGRPGKIVCLGLNYREHAEEGGNEIPGAPLLFSKATSAVIGSGEDIVHPFDVEQVDYEAELAVVVGQKGRRVDRTNAEDYIAGFTAFNDVSGRDVQYAFSQYFRGKAFDTFAPTGPAVVTPDEVDADDLSISATVNDEVRQDSSTADMIFPVAEVIESVTRTMTIYPGDVIATGTPPGVGVHRDPPQVLEAGDTVRVDIEGIGSLTNRVVPERET